MDVDIRQLYDSDPRPTFIVDCEAQTTTVYHVNAALLAIPHIASSLHLHSALRDWWDPASRVAACHQDEFLHGRYRWAKFTACNRWLVVTILDQPPPNDEQSSYLREPAQLARVRLLSPHLQPVRDTIFTVNIQSPELRAHIEHIRNVNWSKTSLGPISSWSYELNVMVTTLMLETRPTALFLGPEHTILYNLAYALVSGSRHPAILGQRIIDAWPELTDPISATMARSESTRFADAPEEEYHVMIERFGFIEEAFFMWSLIPLVGVHIDGMLLERRVDSLLKVGQLISKARNTKHFWQSLADAIRPYEYDFPVAILYSQCELLNQTDSTAPIKEPLNKCTLEWSIGYRPSHPAIPQHLDLESDLGLACAMCDSVRDGTALSYQEEDGILPSSLYHDLEQRAFGDPLKGFLVAPIRTYGETILGYLLVGLNTRRPYDDEYKDWIKVFLNLLGASAASLALHEEELHQHEHQEAQAERDRAALNAEVANLTQEASHIAEKLRNFHDMADEVGLGYFEIDINGILIHANETYFTQTGHRRDILEAPPFAYKEYVFEGDIPMIEDQWKVLLSGEPATFEIGWKKKADEHRHGEESVDDYLWTLSACVPIKSANGSVTGFFGCNTDISAQKEATKAVLMRSEAERRLASFTELASVGLYHLNPDLTMKYCNDQWFHITNHPKVPIDQVDWRNVVDEAMVDRCYHDVEVTKRKQGPHTFMIHLKKKWMGPDGILTPTCILVSATAYADGTIMGTMTDVSQMAWAEAIQKNRVEEALESKRQQENFIDMTSHEMRNPLSAMIQCADSIYSSLNEMKALARKEALTFQPAVHAQLKDLISNSLDAVDTIQACATHQKRIVDDILTLSKLDSKLLVISPMVLQPSVLLQDAYKMFKDEANKAKVNLEVRYDPSIADLNIDWAVLDPSRVLQVLINLLTNAIKFTQGQEVRKVEVTMGASWEVQQMPGIEYVPQEAVWKDFLTQAEWDHVGEVFYLHFTVKDTGCGLSPEHRAKLFLRFSQATPKTHVQYGGSGLGLFISRELTEMQGGSIGVSSIHNVGSTFTFYIKSRRAKAPVSAPIATESIPNDSLPTRFKTQSILGDDKTYKTALPAAISLEDQEGVRSIEERKYHILIVEDNLINQRVLCKQLKQLGHTTYIANHGIEALSQLARTVFSASPSESPPLPLSVVLMDVEMPVMDGLTCTRRIREMERNGQLSGHVPIVAVSANARKEQIDTAKEAGVDEAICKPFRIPELVQLMKRLDDRGEW
ncbi:hypothetical protein G6011_09156 [Alternaria panax]|uniref:Uncharacterized protein n=1 Tax=Alternaria panax TaxID=48097 RepID=A0AAD4IAQ8_9PLEO|nr:hypothetical protein G6011_09156 [Alternaria panax]